MLQPTLNTPRKPSKNIPISKEKSDVIARGEAAAKLMAKELCAEHKRWNLPLLSWQDGKVVKTWPWKSFHDKGTDL